MLRENNLKFIWISSFGQLVDIRIRELSKYLIRSNINPVLVTYRLSKKEKLNQNDSQSELSTLHLKNPLFKNFKNKIFLYLRELVLKLAFILKGFPFLYSDVSDYIKKNTDLKFIYATGPSFFTHILGYLLKRKFQIPLIVEYTDPWYKNPYRIGKMRWLENKIDYFIERHILKSTDIIITNTMYLISIMKTNFPFIIDKPIYSIEDGLKLQEISQDHVSERNKLIITYAGRIYGKRNITPLFKIIYQLKKEAFFEDRPILIKIYGDYPKQLFIRIFKRLKIEDFFYLGDFLPRSDVVEEIKNSDLALHIGEYIDYPTTAFKVWEYLSCRKKILFLNMEHSSRSDFIRNNNLGFIIPIDNLPKAKNVFKELISGIFDNKIDLTFEESKLDQFTWESRSKKFMSSIISKFRE
ncbi:MAG: glycosyltransferase [Promethearchaeota archaeon]